MKDDTFPGRRTLSTLQVESAVMAETAEGDASRALSRGRKPRARGIAPENRTIDPACRRPERAAKATL